MSKCMLCQYCRTREGEFGLIYECHFNPPQAVQDSVEGGLFFPWPKVDKDSWCGKFTVKGVPK